ncbi:MAG TPA: PfkB family carbohydrate kinase [Armatimonadota bacterium]|nr:PfkB family carbohydrate kinase [Armatimonadota bacterium]HPO74722.1 PfkB family carbohydrate kinase [Armatimonadota bacterium]
MHRAITIAASDSAAASGVQSDLKVFDRCGVYGACAVTTITAQDTFTVRRLYKLPASIVGAQIDAVTTDLGVGACKIGWYYSAELTTVIAGRVRRRSLHPVVLDPSLWSERGMALTPPRTIKRIIRELFPVATVVTVTARELKVLSGTPGETAEELASAAARIRAMGPQSVVVEDAPAPEGSTVLVFDARGAEQVASGPARGVVAGAGSIFSAALTAALARGDDLRQGARFAARFLEAAIGNAEVLGKGLPVAATLPVMEHQPPGEI